MIIIPDVHGRLYWYDAVNKRKKGEKLIYLGDYHDPYGDEEEIVYLEQSIERLHDIIAYKKEHLDDTECLLGNHDLGYLDPNICNARRDKANYIKLRNLFMDNLDLFKIAYETEINNTRYIFTHAGIHPKWLRSIQMEFPMTGSLADYLNGLFRDYPDVMFQYLGMISRYRVKFGMSYGSCIWADVREWFEDDVEYLDGYYQIFGHTRAYKPIIIENFAMLDARCAFRLNEEGKIIQI